VARYEGQGAFATRSPVAQGEVFISKLAPGDPLKAKMAARGYFTGAGEGEAEPFLVAFDGKRVTRLRPKERTVIIKSLTGGDPAERSLAFVTSFFGGGPYQLMLFEYLQDAPFSRQTSAPVSEYEGRASVGGVLCHVIYVEYVRDANDLRRERWFIGAGDNLPRKVEQVFADDKGRYGAYVLTLSNLRADVPVNASAFSPRAPVGYRVKPYSPPARPALLPVGEAAPEWELRDPSGAAHRLSDYRGQVVVLDFWATWCGPCIRAMPEMQRLHDLYKGKGVVILGVDCWEESNAAAWMRENGYSYGLLLRGEEVARSYRVSTLPTVYVISGEGRIIHRFTGSDAGLPEVVAQAVARAGR
jgi:thiol-disulfide isomerase/thioredoxin